MTMLLLRMLMTRQRSLSYEVWLELTAVIADSYLDRPLQLPTRQGGWQGGEGEGVGYYMVVDKTHITLGLGPAGTSLAFLPTQGKQVHYHPHLVFPTQWYHPLLSLVKSLYPWTTNTLLVYHTFHIYHQNQNQIIS